MTRLLILALALMLGSLPAHAQEDSFPRDRLVGAPELDDRVRSGELDPVQDRVPLDPMVVYMGREPGLEREPGVHGGDLTMLMGQSRDRRQMVVYGYARLVRRRPDLTLEPDILREVEVEEGRIFTLHLRRGHRWSDGHPFTTEDFRYYWEDILGNEDLTGYGLPDQLVAGGVGPTFEVLDDVTVRYTWPAPNPRFLPALAEAAPLYIYAPAHYLRRFHADYAEPEALAGLLQEYDVGSWSTLHTRLWRAYRNENPDLPVLQPWYLATDGDAASRYEFLRNPYFHRIDENGLQLPYIDRVIFQIYSAGLIPANVGAGLADLQARYLQFSDYTVLRQSDDRSEYDVRLWYEGRGAALALYPNLNAEDPAWRDLMQSAEFRRALSLAVNRRQINEVLYYGLGEPAANSVRPISTVYEEPYGTAAIAYDPDQANAILDGLGLQRRTAFGVRQLTDGRPMELVILGESGDQQQQDVLELIAEDFLDVGIRVVPRLLHRSLYRARVFSGAAPMSISVGLNNGIPTEDMDPAELVPSTQQQLQWPQWGLFVETEGEAGTGIRDPACLALMAAYGRWLAAETDRQRAAAWEEILQIHADQIFTIGLVADVPQPVVVRHGLRNLPERGLFNWDPGAHFGIHQLDAVWWESRRPAEETEL